MAVVKKKPTSPGRRFVVQVVNPDLHKGAPHRALVEAQGRNGGRNNAGRVTVRHQGGGHRQTGGEGIAVEVGAGGFQWTTAAASNRASFHDRVFVSRIPAEGTAGALRSIPES